MKKPNTLMVICILVAACLFMNFDNKDPLQKTNPVTESSVFLKSKHPPLNCIDFNQEDIINLTGFIKSQSEVQIQKNNFPTVMRYFKDDNGNNQEDAGEIKALDPSVTSISMNAIVQLYDKVKNTNSNITGVKIEFGLNGDKILMFFTPLNLNCSSPSTSAGGYEYAPISFAKTYTYDASSRNIAEVTDASYLTARIAEYKTNIRIRHKEGQAYGTLHEEPGSWTEDTKSVIFSFQEIFALYHEKYCENGQANYSEDLYIYNGVARYIQSGVTPTGDYRDKHTIFFTYEALSFLGTKKTIRVLFAPVARALAGNAANLAHLCPPSCFPFYKVITKKQPCIGY